VNIYKLLQFLGKNNYKTVVTHHAEFFYTGSCGHSYECRQFMNEKGCQKCPILKEATKSYIVDRTCEAWKMMKKAFSYFKKENIIFSSVSDWVKERSGLSPIVNKFNSKTVLNGIETEIFNYKGHSDVKWLQQRFPNLQSKIIVHVTASFSPDTENIKGSKYIVELANLMPSISFVVAAITHGDLTGLPDNIHFIGRTSTQNELADLYRTANLTVITSRRETFSMIVAESLCCGTPIIGFKAGGPETIAIPEYSEFVDYGNVEVLKNKIEKMLDINWDKNIISDTAVKMYSKERMTESYFALYNKLNNKY
jgi:glycosyltransferase involved in cell wall biosynthesis